MQILDELWYGRICPVKSQNYQTEEYRELTELFSRNEKDLLPTLNQDQKKSLENMMYQLEEMESIVERSAFIRGFRLAVQLMAASI